MEDNGKTSFFGIGFNGLLILTGIILCILYGSGTVDLGGWIYACIPFLIFAGEIVALLFAAITMFLIEWFSYLRARPDHDDPIIPHDEDDIKEED